MPSSDSTPLKRERLTAKLPVEVIERARNAVYWTPGMTLASLTHNALDAYIDALEAERGESFPQRQGQIKLGRPIKL